MEPEKKPRKKKQKHTQPEYKNLNPFKAEEKHYKLYQHQQTDFSTLYNPPQYINVDGYEVCELPFPKGAYLVRSFNSPQTTMKIGLLGLNVTNLDSRDDLYKEEKSDEDKKQEEVQEAQNEQYYFNQKIRWANVGYQYDWTLRKYPEKKTPIHESIQELCGRANKLYNTIKNTKRQYTPESAIINYYGVKDYMTGHLDDAEIDQESPIYSFSFGLSCVFLIGGPTKEDKPTAVRLNSGDLLIMAQYSRQCYHGVPRIIEKSFMIDEKQWEVQVPKEWKNQQKQIRNYFQTHRININARQVYPKQ